MRRQDTFDWVALAGIALLVVATGLPWSASQSCPLFDECGPWTTHYGFEGYGFLAALLGLAGATCLLAIHRPGLSRGLATVFLSLAILPMAAQGFLQDFIIFGETRSPLYGYVLATFGLGVGLFFPLLALTMEPTPARQMETAQP